MTFVFLLVLYSNFVNWTHGVFCKSFWKWTQKTRVIKGAWIDNIFSKLSYLFYLRILLRFFIIYCFWPLWTKVDDGETM